MRRLTWSRRSYAFRPISGVLCEKYLDHKKYKKWNSNNGYVAAPIITSNQQQLSLDIILEEESDEDDEYSYDEDVINVKKFNVVIDDYPQVNNVRTQNF